MYKKLYDDIFTRAITQGIELASEYLSHSIGEMSYATYIGIIHVYIYIIYKVTMKKP